MTYSITVRLSKNKLVGIHLQPTGTIRVIISRNMTLSDVKTEQVVLTGEMSIAMVTNRCLIVFFVHMHFKCMVQVEF